VCVAGQNAPPLSQGTAFRAACAAGVEKLLFSSVQIKTVVKYKGDWSRWTSFERLYDDGNPDLFMVGLSERERVIRVCSFIHYCFVDLKLRASTINGCLSGVAHNFRVNLLSPEIFSHPSVGAACKSATALLERIRDEPLLTARKLPFTVSMLRDLVLHETANGSMLGQMIASAAQLGLFCLFRSSEYVGNHRGGPGNQCHAILAKDVLFEVTHDNGESVWFNASEVTVGMWPWVTLIKFTLRSAKNDRLRMGSVFFFRNLASYSPGEFNIVRVCFDWACTAGLAPSSFFFSYRMRHSNAMCLLTYDQMAAAIKRCVVRHGFRPEDYSTHSLRIGGACTLRAGGASDSMIELLGRWKDVRTALGYTESGMREFDLFQRVLSDESLFTVKDVQLLHTKGRQQEASSAGTNRVVVDRTRVRFANL